MSNTEQNFVITGASRGIGRSVALELAHKGCNLALISRGKKDLELLQKELSSRFPALKVLVLPCDVSNYSQVRKVSAKIRKEFGAIDGLINNAGFAWPDFFEKQPLEKFAETMNVKYLGAVHMTRELLPVLRDGGYLSFVASVLAYTGLYAFTSYAPANYALIGLAESLEQELMDRRIRVSVLCPPDTETPGFHEENKIKPFVAYHISQTADVMQPDDVARKYLHKMFRGKFIITVNMNSALIYWSTRFLPGTFRAYLRALIRHIRKKDPLR